MRLLGIVLLAFASASCSSDFECYADPACGDGQICSGGRCVAGSRSGGDRGPGDGGATDVYGPLVNITAPLPYELVSGVITIKATILDQTIMLPSGRKELLVEGVDSAGVSAVIMGSFPIEMNRDPQSGAAGGFFAEFDTSLLGMAGFPSLVVTAYDVLGNKGEAGIEFALDSRGPVVALESRPVQFYRVSPDGAHEGGIECSRVINPLGNSVQHGDVITPGSQFGLAFVVRARIEDRGNGLFPDIPIPIFGVNEETARLYMLDKTGLDADGGTRKLLISDGAGGCRINPVAIPDPANPRQDQAIVQNLVPGGPTGEPSFAMYPVGSATQIPVNQPCDYGGYEPPTDDTGSDEEPAPFICPEVDETATIWMHYAGGEAAIWMLNDYEEDNLSKCGGGFFDANNFSRDGPICMAVAAEDAEGNASVSQPIAICVETGGNNDCTNFSRTLVNPANMCSDGCATGPNAPLGFGDPTSPTPEMKPWIAPEDDEDGRQIDPGQEPTP